MAGLTRRRQVEASPAARSIAGFTRVSKRQAFPDASARKVAAIITEPTVSRKRKAIPIGKATEKHPRVTRRTSFPPSSDDEEQVTPSKRACRREPIAVKSASTLIKGSRTAEAAPSQKATSSRPGSETVQTTLDAFCQFGGQKTPSRASRDEEDYDHDGGFPPHLADLVRLHKAFVKTAIIQIAHSGSNAPIDIASLSPNISRAWGKRRATVDDIRRCIAMQTSTRDPNAVSPFIVSDYGRGRVCVELRPDRAHERLSINEDRLCRQFEDNLRALCAERARDDMSDVDVPLDSLSLADLPQVAITNMDTGVKANPVFAKGQRALSELRNGISAKQQEREAKQQPTDILNPDGTKMSLLDRLRLKQLAKANGPLPPSGPELERRAALNRVTDVAATISMLSLSNPVSLPRQAFTMGIISQKLKDSLRVPLSQEEGTACVRLIANEMAPEWLRIVTIGGRENVVIQRHAQPVDRVISERVQKLLA